MLKNETIVPTGNIVRTFDSSANLLNETKFGVSTGFTYDSAGNVSSRTDARNFTTSFLDYFRGTARQENRPGSITISRTVDQHGNVTSQTDGAGNNYQYSYDGIRRVITKTPPVKLPTSTSWTSSTQATSTRGLYTEVHQLDGLGYGYKVTRHGIPTREGHNVKGQRTFESLPDGEISPGSWTGYWYPRDNLGRVRQVMDPIGNLRTVVSSGNGVAETDQLSRTTNYSYASFGDPNERFLTRIDFPDSTSMLIGRDDVGNVTSVTKGALTRTYGYNGSYFLTSMVDPETGTTTFGRDAMGNMTSRTVGGQTTDFTYDGLGRLTGVTYPGGGTVGITYLGNGRTATVTTPQTAWTYAYDSNANLTSETLAIGGQTFTIEYAYNGNDALSTITYPRTGSVISYAPDPLGRPTSASPYVTSVAYFSSGNVREMMFANGIKTTSTENSRQWPQSAIVARDGQPETSYASTWTSYDKVGNVIQSLDFMNPSLSKEMMYDDLDQLRKTTGSWGEAWNVYDPVGNLTGYNLVKAPVSQTRLYNYSANKLTMFGGRAFTHDALGNVTSDGRHAYQYDPASNLTCVDCGTAAQITYVYDGNNRRVSRTQNGVTTYFVTASNGDLLIEFTPSTNKSIEHIYLRGKRIASRSLN